MSTWDEMVASILEAHDAGLHDGIECTCRQEYDVSELRH